MDKIMVEVRIVKPGPRASVFTPVGFVHDGEDLVFRSRLEPDVSVSDHLKWMHGVLQWERKRWRKLQEEGVKMVCQIRAKERTVTIEPEALLLMHQLHLQMEISLNR